LYTGLAAPPEISAYLLHQITDENKRPPGGFAHQRGWKVLLEVAIMMI
jgi:hypothetical protein